ncbi:MAG: TPM domain-containing protein [Balneolaceae bacterium]
MHKLVTLLMTSLLLILFSGIALGQNFPDEPVGHVNDFADILSSSEEAQLESKLRAYRDSTTNVITIATLNDLQGEPIENVATQLFNDWQMWHEERYNGILILIAPSERKMRIEVGYGLEGAVPDVMAGRIIREVLTPEFRRNNFYGGLDRASTILIDLSEGEFDGPLAENSESWAKWIEIAFIALFLLFVFISLSRGGRHGGKRKRRHALGSHGTIWIGSGGFGKGSSGGGGFGGFGGGGGFGSGGGGASGGW